MIVHLVLLRLRVAVKSQELQSFAQSLTAICRALPAVQTAWVGARSDIDPGYSRSFGESTYDYAAILHFADRDGLLEYLRHPLHSEVGRRFWDLSETTVVFEGELFDLKRDDLPVNWSTDKTPDPP